MVPTHAKRKPLCSPVTTQLAVGTMSGVTNRQAQRDHYCSFLHVPDGPTNHLKTMTIANKVKSGTKGKGTDTANVTNSSDKTSPGYMVRNTYSSEC